MTTVPGSVQGVPLDGTGAVLVPFAQPFATAVLSVVVTYNPPLETDYSVTAAVIGTPTVNGFVLSASGAPPGTTGTFTYTATGY